MSEQRNNQPSPNTVENLEHENELLQELVMYLLKRLKKMPMRQQGECTRCLASAEVSTN